MADISSFLGALKNGGARPNRFETVINFPSFTGGSDAIRQTPFLVSSASFPGSNVGVIEQPFRGRQLKIAGDRTFEEWEATFIIDIDYTLHDAFEAWHNGINAYNSNTGFQSPSEYLSTIEVHQLDNQDNRVKSKTLKLAWPSNVTPIEFSQDSNDTIATFSVTFAFSDIDHDQST